jgi:hypothetical protein
MHRDEVNVSTVKLGTERSHTGITLRLQPLQCYFACDGQPALFGGLVAADLGQRLLV